MPELPVDEIALVPRSLASTSDASSSAPIQVSQCTHEQYVIVRKSPAPSSSCRKKLLQKYRRAPIRYIQVLLLGICLLLLIVGCIIIETWKNSRNFNSSDGSHDKVDRLYHLNIVNQINMRNLSWKARYNPFASRQQDNSVDVAEVSKLLHKKYSLDTRELLQDTEEHLKQLVGTTVDLPENFDIRTAWPKCWTVHLAHNQGGCGSCWSVAATAVMSDRICIASNGSRQVQVSAQDLTSCCTTCGGCQGTHWALSSFTFWKEHGLVSGGDYGSSEGCRPYEIASDCGAPCSSLSYTKTRTPACSTKCQPLYKQTYEEDLVKASAAYWVRAEKGSSEATPIVHHSIQKIVKAMIPDNYSELLKKEVYLHGPILACFTLYEDFQHYESGVYKSLSVPNPKELYGHCAKLVGWGVDRGVSYWTYMNTWGRDWGENGFFRIAMGEIPEEAVAGLP